MTETTSAVDPEKWEAFLQQAHVGLVQALARTGAVAALMDDPIDVNIDVEITVAGFGRSRYKDGLSFNRDLFIDDEGDGAEGQPEGEG